MSRGQFNPNWPAPAEVARDDLRDHVNVSRLPAEDKRRAFEAMKEKEPGMADFVSQMHQTFGRSELLVDPETAKRLGVGGDSD